MTDERDAVDPTADTVPIPDAPCDVGGCRKPWKFAIPNKDGSDTLYVCHEHREEWFAGRS